MSPLVDQPRSKGGFSLGDYVEVKDRIRLFYEAYPTGAICTEAAWVSVDDDVPRIWVRAAAYRSPDDSHPGIGHSWMVLPGTTSYTKGSELENTETSAWGRAIGATGIALDKSVASADEVRNKEGQTDRAAAKQQWDGAHVGPVAAGLPYVGKPDRPELERRADGLIGTVVKGATPADLELRYDPDGVAFWGFKLKAGKTAYQAFATGPLAEQLRDAAILTSEAFEGQNVTVWGKVEMVPWFKGDKAMPPYARIVVERLATSEWAMPPLPDTLTVPMFDEVGPDNTAAGHEHWADS
jgi:hypothetical protein